jgi:hypothetical protein
MDFENLKEYIGFGIAGNFANHLEQAGEIVDFVNVEVDEVHAPKGIFPFYLPKFDTFLQTFPLSSETINIPDYDCNLQLEPEVALICEISYKDDIVADITPKAFCAYNDCSIRKEGAKKISEKKNWGSNSKGISTQTITLDKFENGGVMDSYHIASYLKRDGKLHEYGNDSAVTTYNYFYNKLQNWIVDKLNTQKDSGPLEDLNSYLKKINHPTDMIISIGATSYTEFGESTYLQKGDEVYVVVYDSNIYKNSDIKDLVSKDDYCDKNSISVLHQVIK